MWLLPLKTIPEDLFGYISPYLPSKKSFKSCSREKIMFLVMEFPTRYPENISILGILILECCLGNVRELPKAW
jgi:hypothetical protein